jgi:aspartyl-tRNA(Asn)/glutamyl-tRNA(Gln) amidotransferase subunit A
VTAVDPRPTGSTAREAFADSARVLAGYEPSRPSLAPSITFRPLPGPPLPPRRPHDDDSHSPSTVSPLIDARDAIASGASSARDVLERCLDRVAALDEPLVAFATLDVDGARRAADACDEHFRKNGPRGPLHGVPLSVKDVIDVAGFPTRCGSLAYLDRPPRDAVSVARLRAAGAVIVGKATTHEFALGVTNPQSRNPHDPTRIPGGSSGGSAITVATGMALGSLGTDTRASIRVPAALSGVVGFKPTFGGIPTEGVVPLSWTMDHVAPMASTVPDVATLLQVLTQDDRTSTWLDARVDGWRIGVAQSTLDGCDPEVAAAFLDTLDVCRALGCRIVEIDSPTDHDLEDANAAGLIVSRSEAGAFHRSRRGELERYWPEVGEQIDESYRVLAVDYLDAQRLRVDLGHRLLDVFDLIDIVAMPTVPVLAPPIDDFARYLMVLSRNAIPWSFLGFPALSTPCGRSLSGLPIGAQFVGPPGHDGPVIALGAAFERERGTW